MNTTRLKTFETQLKKSGILNFTNDLPKDAEIYLVGGTVRDIILNRENPGDLDLVIRNVKINTLEKILKKHGRVNFVGKNFGIFKFCPKNPKKPLPKSDFRNLKSEIDIALPRTEHSFGTGAYKDFKITYNHKLPIKKDLSRRDFTINAMAYQLNNKTSIQAFKHSSIHDPYHGLADLKNKTIHTVGNPKKRFKEDYSRLLRAIRIACELNFNIEKKTFTALKKLIPHINDTPSHPSHPSRPKRLVPYEIIAPEILKSFTGSPVRALELLDESGALHELIPELLTMKNCPQPKEFHTEGDVWTHTRLALSLINSKKFKKEFPQKQSTTCLPAGRSTIELTLATLLHDIGKPAVINIVDNKIKFHGHSRAGANITKNICARLKFSSAPDFDLNCQNLVHLVSKHMVRLFERVNKLKNSTVIKYFLIDTEIGDKLLKLFWLDAMASVPKKGKPDLSGFHELKKRIAALKKQLKITKAKPLLTGNEIMSHFKLKPGPKVGRLKSILREAQLAGLIKTKKGAITLLKRELK